MSLTLKLAQTWPETSPRMDLREAAPLSLEGRIKRVDYQKRELSVVADGRVWTFALAADCQLWFEGRLVPLRCFHPLDDIRIFYEVQGGRHVALALYVWEFFR